MRLLAQEAEQQFIDLCCLFLLHPVAGTLDQMAGAHLGARAILHAFKGAWSLIGAPVALAGNEHRGDVDRASSEQLQLCGV